MPGSTPANTGRTRSRCSRSRRPSRVPELVPIRYGRMMVSPFTFYRGAALIMASDLAGDTELRTARPDLRRRPPVELRGVRLGRATADLRHERLRRDAPRSVGVGREAARREPRDRRARQRLGRRDAIEDRAGGRARVPRDHDQGRRHEEPRGLVLEDRPRGADAGRPERSSTRSGSRPREEPREGTDEGQHARLREAHRRGRRRAAHHQRPAPDRSDRGAHGHGPRCALRRARAA